MATIEYTIPEFVNGIDIETKSTKHNAFVIAIGGVTISTRTLQIISTVNLAIDPQCGIQKTHLQRDVCQKTIDWWFPNEPTEFTPSETAQRVSWGGITPTDTALTILTRWLKEVKGYKGGCVYTMRGPEFDYVVLNDLYQEMGLWFDINFSLLDSHRTTDRGLLALGIDPTLTEKEIGHISPSDNYVVHIAISDAAKEAYQTAFYYHILRRIRLYGYEAAMVTAANMKNGIYEAIPNDTE